MKVKVTPQGCLIALQPGDLVQASLQEVFISQGYPAAWAIGLGVVHQVELGFFVAQEQRYTKTQLEGSWELTNLTGNLSLKEGKAFCHSHVSLSGPDFAMRGGHLFEAVIHVAGEFFLAPVQHPLTRTLDQATGLFLWDL